MERHFEEVIANAGCDYSNDAIITQSMFDNSGENGIEVRTSVK
jgi:hypothetical protein